MVKAFVPRRDEMGKLERALLPARERRQRQRRQIVYGLRGMGGMGKTQLAVEFARTHQARFSSVFWLDGSSACATFCSSYRGNVISTFLPDDSKLSYLLS